MMKKIPVPLLFILTGCIVYILFLRSFASQLYCLKKVHTKIANFRSAAFRLGVVHIDEEESYIRSIFATLYKECLTE